MITMINKIPVDKTAISLLVFFSGNLRFYIYLVCIFYVSYVKKNLTLNLKKIRGQNVKTRNETLIEFTAPPCKILRILGIAIRIH